MREILEKSWDFNFYLISDNSVLNFVFHRPPLFSPLVWNKSELHAGPISLELTRSRYIMSCLFHVFLSFYWKISDTSGGTALHNACGNGHAGAAKLLLMAGAQLMVWDNEHMNPLHYAATGEGALVKTDVLCYFSFCTHHLTHSFPVYIVKGRSN